MFFFSSKKNKIKEPVEPQFTEKEIISSRYDWNEKNPVDFLTMLIDSKISVKAILLDTSAFKGERSLMLVPKALDEVFYEFARIVQGRVFELANKSVMLAFKDNREDELQALLIRLQFMFNEEMFLSDETSIQDTDFLNIYDTIEGLKELKNKIINQSPYTAIKKDKENSVGISGVWSTVLGTSKKQLRELSPTILDKMQKSSRDGRRLPAAARFLV